MCHYTLFGILNFKETPWWAGARGLLVEFLPSMHSIVSSAVVVRPVIPALQRWTVSPDNKTPPKLNQTPLVLLPISGS